MVANFTRLGHLAIAAALLAAGVQMQAQGLPGKPEAYNFRSDDYPRLMEDNSVIFGVVAPNAQKVQLCLRPSDTPIDMTRGEDGTWTVRTQELAPGFHYYWFLIDGAEHSGLYDDLQPYNEPGMQPFKHELLENIIPLVDGSFRTIAKSCKRAMCGLSQGAGESYIIGLKHPEYFSAIGVFSCGLLGRTDYSWYTENSAQINADYDVVYFSCGTEDYLIWDYEKLIPALREGGLNVVYEKFPGHHEFQPWRYSIHSFAQKLWK